MGNRHFQPWVTAVDRLIYRGARINGAAVAPHAFVPALTGEVIGFADQCLADAALLRRLLSENRGHRPRLHKLLQTPGLRHSSTRPTSPKLRLKQATYRMRNMF